MPEQNTIETAPSFSVETPEVQERLPENIIEVQTTSDKDIVAWATELLDGNVPEGLSAMKNREAKAEILRALNTEQLTQLLDKLEGATQEVFLKIVELQRDSGERVSLTERSFIDSYVNEDSLQAYSQYHFGKRYTKRNELLGLLEQYEHPNAELTDTMQPLREVEVNKELRLLVDRKNKMRFDGASYDALDETVREQVRDYLTGKSELKDGEVAPHGVARYIVE